MQVTVPIILLFYKLMASIVYYHTVLLTYRPFLIFRNHWQRGMEMPRNASAGASKHPKEIPAWLNEACNHVLMAARKSIHHLYEASYVNDYVKVRQFSWTIHFRVSFTLSGTAVPWVFYGQLRVHLNIRLAP